MVASQLSAQEEPEYDKYTDPDYIEYQERLQKYEAEHQAFIDAQGPIPPVIVYKDALVEFESSFSAMIEIYQKDTKQILMKDNFGHEEKVDVNDGVIELDGLLKDRVYSFFALGMSGEFEYFHSLETRPGINGENTDLIEVSQEIWNLLAEFDLQKKNIEKALPLYQFLNEGYQGVHSLEAMEYYQKAIMEGEVYKIEERGRKIVSYDQRRPPGDCRCNTLALIPSNTPGQTSGSIVQGERWYVSKNYRDHYDPDVGGDDDVHNIEFGEARGPAMYQYAQVGGWRAPCGATNRAKVGIVQDSTYFSKMNRLAVKLSCNNGLQLPEDCECRKLVNYHYNFISRLTVEAGVKDQWGDQCKNKRNGVANAQSFSFIYLTRLGTPSAENGWQDVIEESQLLEATDFRVEAECEAQSDDDAWLSGGEAAQAIFGELVDFTATALGDGEDNPGDLIGALGGLSLDTIIASIGELIQVIVGPEYDCTIFDGGDQTTEGQIHTILNPNEELYFTIRSHGVTQVKGRRNYSAHARVESGYYHSLVVNPGLELEDEGCCTKWVAAYSGTSYDGARSRANNRHLMGSDLILDGFTDCLVLEDSEYFTRGERGSCTLPSGIRECDEGPVSILADHNDFKITPFNDDTEDDSYIVQIFNTSGVLIHEQQSSDPGALLEEIIASPSTGMPVGIYLVRAQGLKSHKLFVSRFYLPN